MYAVFLIRFTYFSIPCYLILFSFALPQRSVHGQAAHSSAGNTRWNPGRWVFCYFDCDNRETTSASWFIFVFVVLHITIFSSGWYRRFCSPHASPTVQRWSTRSLPCSCFYTGETPHTVTLFAFDDLVDSVRPGDRIEVKTLFSVRSLF